jgi:Arc-like DNA binding domain
MARKTTNVVQLKLRFSETLRRRLERDAAQNRRSMNAEIIARLEQAYFKSTTADLIAETVRETLNQLREERTSVPLSGLGQGGEK